MRFQVRTLAEWRDGSAPVERVRVVRAMSRRHAIDKALRMAAAEHPGAPEHAAEILDGPAQGGPAAGR